MLDCDGYVGISVERKSSRYHLEKRYAQRIDIRLGAYIAAPCLLGREIVYRAHLHAGHSDRCAGSSACDTEVRYLRDTVTGDKDVLGLDVPVNDTVLVSVIQSKTDLDNDRYCITPVQVTVLVDEIFYGDAFDIFLDDVSEVAFVTYTENLYDVCVVK